MKTPGKIEWCEGDSAVKQCGQLRKDGKAQNTQAKADPIERGFAAQCGKVGTAAADFQKRGAKGGGQRKSGQQWEKHGLYHTEKDDAAAHTQAGSDAPINGGG